jgi:DNA-binding transcriptional LysR family regulator
MALLLPRRHPLARAPRVRARDLAEVSLLLTEQGCAYREATERALVERGVASARNVELGSVRALHHAVAAGLGVAVVPSAGARPPAGTVLRPVVDVDLSLPVGLIRRVEAPAPSPALAAFLVEVRERLRDAG